MVTHRLVGTAVEPEEFVDRHCTLRVRLPPQEVEHEDQGDSRNEYGWQGHVLHACEDAGALMAVAQSRVGSVEREPSVTDRQDTVRTETPPLHSAEQGPHCPVATQRYGNGHCPLEHDCTDVDDEVFRPHTLGDRSAFVTPSTHTVATDCVPPPHRAEQASEGIVLILGGTHGG